VGYKALSIYQKENEARLKQSERPAALEGPSDALLSMGMGSPQIPNTPKAHPDGEEWDPNLIMTQDVDLNERARDYLEVRRKPEARNTLQPSRLTVNLTLKARATPDVVSVGVILCLWAIFSCMYVLIKHEDDIAACSAGYWGAIIGLYPILIIFTFIGVWWVLKDQTILNELVEGGAIKPISTEVAWDVQKVFLYGGASVLVGFVGGILGLGGAEFMAPLMLEMGMAPPVAAATAAYMNLFTSGSNIVHYSQMPGVLPPHYTGWLCAMSFMAGLGGRSISSSIAAAGRQSVVVFALATVLITSAGLLAWRAVNSPVDWSFHASGFCK